MLSMTILSTLEKHIVVLSLLGQRPEKITIEAPAMAMPNQSHLPLTNKEEVICITKMVKGQRCTSWMEMKYIEEDPCQILHTRNNKKSEHGIPFSQSCFGINWFERIAIEFL